MSNPSGVPVVTSAVDSFSNPEVLTVIAILINSNKQKSGFAPCLNSQIPGMLRHPQHPLQSTPLATDVVIFVKSLFTKTNTLLNESNSNIHATKCFPFCNSQFCLKTKNVEFDLIL